MSSRKRQRPTVAAFDHLATGSGVGARIDALGPTGDEADRIIRVPLHALVASRSQPRAPITPASVAELVRQIRGVGLLNPITVCPTMSPGGIVESYEVIAGHRRVEAFRILAAEDPTYGTVPAIIQNFDELEKVVATQVENLGRLGLTVWETARGIASLRRALEAAGLPSTVDAIREKIGQSLEGGDAGVSVVGDEGEASAPSRGGVSQYLRIGEIVTEALLRAAGATVPEDPNGTLDYALISKLRHKPLMRVVKAAAEQRVDVLRQVVAEHRAPATPRTRRVTRADAVDCGARDAAPSAAYTDGAIPPLDPHTVRAADTIQRLTPEQAREALDRLLPTVAALAEVARDEQMVLTADAGSMLVAFIRSVDPTSRGGQFVSSTLAARIAEHHAAVNARTRRTATSITATARRQRV